MPARLGDDVDDYCIKCKRLTNHIVVSLLNDDPAKVRCRTCHSDHDYRHEQAPPPKVDSRKAALFKQVLGDGPAAGGVQALTAAPTPGNDTEPTGENQAAPEGEATDGTPSATVAEAPLAAKPKARRKAQGQ